jgi:iron complex transport system substrate-binding protein
VERGGRAWNPYGAVAVLVVIPSLWYPLSPLFSQITQPKWGKNLMKVRLFAVLLLVLGVVSLISAQETTLAEGCVAEYDATTDYFPEKATIDYANGFTLEYFLNYKVITVTAPFPGATPDDGFQYVLVQCGTPSPTDFDDAAIIEIPSGKIIAMSTTFLPHLVVLDLVDNLVGVDSLLYINTPEIVAKGTDGELTEVGFGSGVNVEQVLALEPSLVMANASGSPEYDAHPVLLDAGINVAISADYVEQDPLGRAEWLKFTAAFFNKDGEAQAIFADIAIQYEDLLALTANIDAQERITVLWDSFDSYSNAWFVPGQNTYVARILQDAGVNYVLSDSPNVQDFDGSVPLDFESVYASGENADIWLAGSFGVGSLADLLTQDDRYADFGAFQSGAIFTNGAKVNANGGNDYYESGVLNPQLVLADLIKIAYPELLPDYELTYFVQLQ